MIGSGNHTGDGSDQAATNARVGRCGESAAASHLKRGSYKILARNLQLRGGEIDLVCLNPERTQLVVVEVKSTLIRPIETALAPSAALQGAGPQGPARPQNTLQTQRESRPEQRVNPDKSDRLRRLARSVHSRLSASQAGPGFGRRPGEGLGEGRARGQDRLGLRIDIVGVDLRRCPGPLGMLRPYRVADLRHHMNAVPF